MENAGNACKTFPASTMAGRPGRTAAVYWMCSSQKLSRTRKPISFGEATGNSAMVTGSKAGQRRFSGSRRRTGVWLERLFSAFGISSPRCQDVRNPAEYARKTRLPERAPRFARFAHVRNGVPARFRRGTLPWKPAVFRGASTDGKDYRQAGRSRRKSSTAESGVAQLVTRRMQVWSGSMACWISKA